MCFLNAYANAFVCSVIGENSNLLRWPCRKGSEFKFQQIEPKSTRTYNLEGEIYLCITGVWCRFVVKTLRKKTDPESLALFPTGPPQLNPATTTIWIRLLLLRYVFAAGTRSSVRLYFVCLFPCIQSTRANVFWKQSLRCLVVCKSPPLTEIDCLRQFTTPSSFRNRFLSNSSYYLSCRIIRASRQILPLKGGYFLFSSRDAKF